MARWIRKGGSFFTGMLVGVGLAAVLAVSTIHAQARGASLKITPLIQQELSDIEGKNVTVVKLDYPPGSASPAHRHPGHVFVYVLSGKLTSQLNDGEPVVYGPGEIFYEAPMGLHAQSKNDEKEGHAVALAFILGDTGKPQTLLEPAHGH